MKVAMSPLTVSVHRTNGYIVATVKAMGGNTAELTVEGWSAPMLVKGEASFMIGCNVMDILVSEAGVMVCCCKPNSLHVTSGNVW